MKTFLSTFMSNFSEKIREDVKGEIKEQIIPIVNRLDELDERTKKLSNRINDVETKINNKMDMEARKRNIMIFNMREKDNESPETLEEMVLHMITNIMKVKNCNTYHIDYTSRIGSNMNGKRPIVLKFTTQKMKMMVWKNRRNLKGKEYRIELDYNQEIRKKRKELVPQVKQLRNQGIKAGIRKDRIVTWGNTQMAAIQSTPQSTLAEGNKKRQHSLTPEYPTEKNSIYSATPKRFQGDPSSCSRTLSYRPKKLSTQMEANILNISPDMTVVAENAHSGTTNNEDDFETTIMQTDQTE